jgi:hypothetical protein
VCTADRDNVTLVLQALINGSGHSDVET